MPFILRSIKLRGGPQFTPGKLTVIVGPNNSGKTQAIRDLVNALTVARHAQPPTVLVDQVTAAWPATLSELKGDLGMALVTSDDGSTHIRSLQPTLVEAFHANLGAPSNWESEVQRQLDAAQHGDRGNLPEWFGPTFVAFLRTDDRLKLTSKFSGAIEPYTRPNLLVALYYDVEAERLLDNSFYRAFNLHIKLDSSAFGQLLLRVGADFADVPVDSRLAGVQLGRRLQLDQQGDGMRSFAGIALGLLVGARPLVLLDEPEAFLHPPQAVHVGEMIATLVRPDRQIVVATHSADVLRGILNKGGDFDILRLTRDAELSTCTMLEASEVRKIASDPVLSTTRVIEGLFYRAAVAVESDSDSAFYHRVARQVRPADDVLYTRAHNKQTLHKVLRPYRALGVKAAAIADFDIIKRGDELNPLLAAATDENLDQPLALQEQIRALVESELLLEKLAALKKDVEEILNAWPAVVKPDDAPPHLSNVRRALERVVDDADPWAATKQYGIERLPPAARGLFDQLRAWCARRGIFIVRSGELESMMVAHGVLYTRHKAAWIIQALTKLHELHPDTSTSPNANRIPWSLAAEIHEYLLGKMAGHGAAEPIPPSATSAEPQGEAPVTQ